MLQSKYTLSDLSCFQERPCWNLILLHLVEDLTQTKVWQRSVRITEWYLAWICIFSTVVKHLKRMLILTCPHVYRSFWVFKKQLSSRLKFNRSLLPCIRSTIVILNCQYEITLNQSICSCSQVRRYTFWHLGWTQSFANNDWIHLPLDGASFKGWKWSNFKVEFWGNLFEDIFTSLLCFLNRSPLELSLRFFIFFSILFLFHLDLIPGFNRLRRWLDTNRDGNFLFVRR